VKPSEGTKVFAVVLTGVTTMRGLVTWSDSRDDVEEFIVEFYGLDRFKATGLSIVECVGERLDALAASRARSRQLPVWRD
jgi:hypothetical protein